MKKRIIRIIGAAVMFTVSLMLIQRLLMPKYMSGVYEGRLIAEYYAETKTHDVIIIGDCEVYDNISPMTLWENYGITSYIRGSPQQLIWQSYYLLEETFKYEIPKVVVFSVLSMMYNEPQSEAYNRLTLDGMRLGVPKLKAISASMTKGEQYITYILPILRYHDRWRDLSEDDFRYFFSGGRVSHNGYMMRCDVKPVSYIPTGPKLPDYRFGQTSYEYLGKITALCKAKGVELILFKSPSLYPYWYGEWDAQMVQYAADNGITYVNTLDIRDDIGLDWDNDTFNGGLNLNVYGAEKVSLWLGNILTGSFGLQDRRQDGRLSDIWEKKRMAYYAMKDKQLEDLELYGAIRTFTY